jgi:hypothetical protein
MRHSFFDEEVGATIDAAEFPAEIDAAEQENLYREACLKALGVLVGVIDFIRNGRSDEMPYRAELAAYVFGHPALAGASLDELGMRYDKSRAAISAQILRLQRANKLPENLVQKNRGSRAGYSRTVREKLARN